MAPSTALEVRKPATDLVDTLIRDDETAIAHLKAALPENVTLAKFTTALQTALIDDAIEQRDPGKQLMNADRASLFQAVVKCAADGLIPDRREAALVRYGDKVQYLPMIGGVRKKAAEFGWTIRTHVAYTNDLKFEVIEGTDQRIDHRPAAPGADRGKLMAAYAVASHRDGRQSLVEVMYEKDIAKVRAMAKTQKVWNEWEPQMWEKSVGHRIADKLPLDPQERAQLKRMIDASELDPGEATVLLYGRQAEDAAPSTTTPPSADGTGGDRQQAGDAQQAAAEQSPAPGADPASAFGGGGETVATGDEDMLAAQQAAGYEVTVPNPEAWVNGLTLSQINARGDEGLQFFKWALGAQVGKFSNRNEELRAKAAAYVKVQQPALYAELVGGDQ